MNVIQPDLEAAERLLGTCDRCKHWYLIDLLPDLTEGIMMRLPDTRVVRSLSQENPSLGVSLMGENPEGQSSPPLKPIILPSSLPPGAV